MSYVPVNLWVPDTVEGPTVTSVNLMDDHVAKSHQQAPTPT